MVSELPKPGRDPCTESFRSSWRKLPNVSGDIIDGLPRERSDKNSHSIGVEFSLKLFQWDQLAGIRLSKAPLDQCHFGLSERTILSGQQYRSRNRCVFFRKMINVLVEQLLGGHTSDYTLDLRPPGHGRHDADLVAVLQGRAQAFQEADVFTIHVDVHEAAHLAGFVHYSLAHARVRTFEVRDERFECGAITRNLRKVAGEAPQGLRNQDSNGHGILQFV